MVFGSSASIELPPRRTPRGFPLPRFWLARLFGVKPALLAAPDATVRPQSFEDHFRCGRCATGILAILNSEPADVFHEALNLRELLVALRSRREVGQLQFAAQLEPLNHALEADVGEMLAEDAPHRRANQLARDGVGAFQFAL